MSAPTRHTSPLLDLVAIVVLVTIATLGLASTFLGWGYLGLAVMGAVLGIVVVASTLRLPGVTLVATLPIVAVLIGGPIAMREPGVDGVLPNLGNPAEVMTGSITGWYELLTTLPFVDLEGPPSLVPFLLGYLGAALAAAFAIRGRSVGWPLVPLIGTLVVVLLLRRPYDEEIGWYPVAFAVVMIIWLVVRGMRHQASALQIRGRDSGRLVRVVTAAVVLATGLGVGTWVTSGRPPSAGTALRGQIETVPDLTQLDSPLRRFRTFTEQDDAGSDNVHDKVLLTVTGAPAGALLRFVTLDKYDGQQWAPSNDTIADTSDDSFLRMDSEVDNPTVGRAAQVQVSISKNYRSVWIPTYGSLTSLHFLLSDSQARRDQIRYNLPTSTALLAGEVGDGDDYEFTSIVPDDRLTRRMRPWRGGIMQVKGIRRVDPLLPIVLASPLPRMEKVFVMAHYLRDVGRFSSGGRPGESMYPSGHDIKRLTKGFLLAPRPVGDDEQYAAAMAIIANRLGVPARVVVGAVVPKDGKVRGRNVHTWVEVRISDGSWRTLYTDQFMGDKPPQPQMEEAEPPSVGDVTIPPQEEATPTEVKVRDQLEEQDDAERRSSAVRWAPWLLVLLLILVVPVVKVLVRARRRFFGRPAHRLAGAWEDVVGQARDLGMSVRAGTSRPEQAREIDAGEELATRIDDGVFGAIEPGTDDVRACWDAAAEWRRGLRRVAPRWRRLWSLFNPASLLHGRVAQVRSAREEPQTVPQEEKEPELVS